MALKMAGGTALAVTALSGTASAHQSKFFGCDRVNSGTDGDFAVVSVEVGYECREMVNPGRPRRTTGAERRRDYRARNSSESRSN